MTKSGRPGSLDPLRQPVMPCARKTSISRSSVALLPAPRMRDMTSDRLAAVKTSLPPAFFEDGRDE